MNIDDELLWTQTNIIKIFGAFCFLVWKYEEIINFCLKFNAIRTKNKTLPGCKHRNSKCK